MIYVLTKIYLKKKESEHINHNSCKFSPTICLLLQRFNNALTISISYLLGGGGMTDRLLNLMMKIKIKYYNLPNILT